LREAHGVLLIRCRATRRRAPTTSPTTSDRDPRLAIFRQTDSGIPVRMAIFAILLGVDHLVTRDLRRRAEMNGVRPR
jgi:hypothetical protein